MAAKRGEIFILAAVLTMLLTACSGEPAAEVEPVTPVAVQVVTAGQVVQREVVSGISAAQERVPIVPQLGGKIIALEVQTGDEISRGQVLVRLEDSEMVQQVRQAEAGLMGAEAQLGRVEAGASEAELAQLESSVAQAEAAVESALVNYYGFIDGFSPAHQQLQGAKAQYEQARIARQQAENQLFEITYGSAIDQADTAVEQARKGRSLLKDQISDLERAIRRLEEQISQAEDAGLDTSELRKELIELESSLKVLEAELEMTEFQVKQAEQARDKLLTETREQAELALRQAEEGEQAAKAQVEMLEKTVNQQEFLAQTQQRQAQASLEAAKAALAQAQKGAREEDIQGAAAGVKQAQAALALARTQLDKSVITAPISGQATMVEAQVGAMAAPGNPLLTIVNAGMVKVEFNLTERLIGEVAPGEQVTVTFPALGDREFRGVVTNISPAPDPRTGVFPVEAVLEDEDGLVQPGFYADVEIVRAVSIGKPVIPLYAVLSEGERQYVYVLTSGRVERRDVKLGLSDGEVAEVLEGLGSTEFLVVKGQHYIEEGSRVSIREWVGGDGR